MEWRIAVCDDDAAQGEYIKNLVLTWAAQSEVSVRVSVYHSAQALLFDGCDRFDGFLLDIEMPGQNGMELARTIRAHHETAVLVFITGYSDYIAQGYDVSALHYLMKPVDKQKLFSVLDKAYRKTETQEQCLFLESASQTHRVPLREIRFIEVSGNYVTIHAAEDIKVKKPLSELQRELDDRFARTGRSFVVNLSYVRRVTRSEVVLMNGDTVPLSRGMYESLNRAIIERL